jgi:excinuclease ABC subunit C
VSAALQEDLDPDTWRTLTNMQETFGLKTLPWRIDAFDISHMSGHEMYGCCVVFEQGRPNPSLYRRFKIRSLQEGEIDDFRAMQETVLRRYSHLMEHSEPMPQFILIDGGAVQLEFAMKSIEELKVDIPVAALAKQEELVFLPGRPEPLRLSFEDPVLRLLQRMRDEVHRYAITTHRNARSGRLRRSVLEEIPGIGRARAAQLLVKFGSVRRIAAMEPEELCAAAGVGKALARKIVEHLRGGE